MTFTDRQQKKKLERRRSRQLYREQRPRVNLNQVLEEINWNIRSRENSLTRSPVSFSVQTSVETTRENSPEQSNDEESGSELSEREFQERVREFENYRTRTIEEARRSRRSRRNSNNNQPLEIVEEENIEEQELGGLREYLQEFEIEIEQEENNEEPIVENNIMDILALRSKKFRGNGTQDPVEWLKNYEKTARMNGWTDDQKKERIYTVLDDTADEWYNEIYTQTYGNGNDEWSTWAIVKDQFLEQFCNRRWMNKWTRELEKFKQQPGESVDQYAARFKRIIRKGAPAMQNAEKLYHFKKGLRKGMLPIISMHNPEDIAAVIELAQHYEEAEDLEEGLEPEESEDEIKVKPKTKRKIKKKKYESESSDKEIPVKKEKIKKKEVEVDPIEELTKKMNELTIKLAKTERPQYNNNTRTRNYDIECYSCGKKGHISKDCKGFNRNNNYRNNYQEHNNNNHNRNNIPERNTPRNNFGNNNNQRGSTSTQFKNNRNNQNQTTAHYVSIEDGNEYETDEEDREIITLWNEQFDSFGNPKETKKRLIEPELIYDYRTDPNNKKKKVQISSSKPKQMEWTPIKNNGRKPIIKTPGKVKNEEYTPKLLQGPELDIVKKLREQKIEITLPQLFKISSNEKRKVMEALRKPKEVSARFTNQEDSLRTTTLECDIIVNGYTVPATIDSGAATSIIARNTMEQLGFDIEEATNCKIISANGEKTESLGKIKDFPVEINDRVIPINMEIMETGAYHILLGNDWMMKAGASYNWSKQELTLNWRNQVIKTTASCKQNNNILENIEEEYESEDEEQIQVLFQENYIN
ncbi:hypothetical protein Glove_492g28 [Diversispora epigaea]|uniref:CCHC-type domain-containing protein n=1 Tax=Diversispora epigaea TaxID=1348612 RepID=A0A397GII1_9GLOM|nr:hypothetical protein Glove_492g28 [Diversispora epigaea]